MRPLRRRGKIRSGLEARRELGLPVDADRPAGGDETAPPVPNPADLRSRMRTIFLGIALVIGLASGVCSEQPSSVPSDQVSSSDTASAPQGKEISTEEAFENCLRAVKLGQAERLMDLWNIRPLDPNTYGRDGKTLLGEAVAIDRPEIVRWLIQQGADPDRKSGGIAPLHLAAQKASPETVGVLLAASITVDLPNSQGETPLFLAARPGRGPVVELLLQARADPARRMTGGRTPLHQAAEWADGKVVGLLIAASAPIDLPDTDGDATPLHLAVIAGNQDTAKTLISCGAHRNLRDRQGSAPLHYAASHPALARMLLEAGADPNLAGDGDRTPLHEAVQAGQSEVVKMFLEHRADRGARSKRGETPLELAKRLKRVEIIDLLEGR